jgi:ABC-type transport system substrate-binding protein
MVSVNGAANPPEPSLHISQRWMCPGVDSHGRWCHEKLDELAIAATKTTDFNERTALYREWNQIFVDEIPAISWGQVPFYHGEHKDLHGLRDLYGVLWFEQVWLDQ